MAKRTLPLFVSLAALVVGLLFAGPGVSANDGDDDTPNIPERRELVYPNLGSHLDEVVASYEQGQQSEREAAEQGVVSQNGSIAVTIYLSGNVSAVEDFLDDNGASVRNVGEDYIEAYVPVSLLGQASQQDGVTRIREIIPPQPMFGNVTSQGVDAHMATAWHTAGYRGGGVKVGIIDSGFYGWQSLQGVELPNSVAGVRCYTDIGVYSSDLAVCDDKDLGEHGTAVAEAIIDIAPEATLYIADPASKGDLREIVDWMASQGVQVINMSLGFTFDGPGDGTSPSSRSPLRAVDRAVNSGIIWANAAGNEAQKTWFGPFNPGLFGIHQFSGRDVLNSMYLESGQPIQASLRWDDRWGGANCDLNLVLWRGGSLDIVSGSYDRQNGSQGDVPTELIRWTADETGYYDLTVSDGLSGCSAGTGWIQMQVEGIYSLGHYSQGGSIGNPAESANPGLLAVGAAHYWDQNIIANYSSRGPTPDGRVKPDIVGTACGQASSYPLEPPEFYGGYDCWFPGTSQASPHVAGLSALVKQKSPHFTPEEVARFLKENAEERGDRGPDNTWGSGFALLPAPVLEPDAPAIESVSPGQQSLTVAWAAPDDDGGAAITAYDLRHIRSDASDKANANWTFVAQAWTSGALEYIITGLAESTHYDVQVRAVNSVGSGPWSATATGATEAPSNAPPSFVEGEQATRTIAENTASGTAVGQPVSATDTDGDTLTYTLTGPDSASFDLDSDSGQIRVKEALDFETKNQYSLTVSVTDGKAADGQDDESVDASIGVAVSVTDEDEQPPTDACTDAVSDGPTSGTWAAGCQSDETGRGYARYYSFTLSESKAVTVNLKSSRDTYLYLRSGDKTGTVVAANDDHGTLLSDTTAPIPAACTNTTGLGQRDSCITISSLSAGSYTIEATTYNPNEAGTFTLTVSGLGSSSGGPTPPPTDTCTDAITADGSTSGTWASGCQSDETGRGYARYYSFTLSESKAVTVNLKSTRDTYLYLRSGDKTGAVVAANDDHGTLLSDTTAPIPVACANTTGLGQRNSCITVSSLDAGSYTIEATTYNPNEKGSFTLTVSGLSAGGGGGPTPPPTDTCTDAISDGATTGTWAAGCQSDETDRGYVRYYSFTLSESKAVTVNLKSSRDTYLYLRSGDKTGTIVAANDDHGTLLSDTTAPIPAACANTTGLGQRDSCITISSLSAGSYTIEATTYNPGEAGSFTLTVSGLGTAPAAACAVGNTLTPGQSCSGQDFTATVRSNGNLSLEFTGTAAPPSGLSFTRSGNNWTVAGLP